MDPMVAILIAVAVGVVCLAVGALAGILYRKKGKNQLICKTENCNYKQDIQVKAVEEE